MDQSLNLIYKAFYFVGFHQFPSKPEWKYWFNVNRLTFFSLTVLFHAACVWCICFDDHVEFNDKMYVFSMIFGTISCDFQYQSVWSGSDSFNELFEWVAKLHKPHENEIIERMSRNEYVRLADLLWKFIR